MRQLKPNVYAVGAIDWDARLFDRLILLPDGTSYNSYLIRGNDKVALLDTVDPTKTEVLLENLFKLGINKIDYVVAHHAEQDHSGSLPDILLVYPDAKIVTNPKRIPVLVHCQHGADRTGIICALYRIIIQGWTKEDAIKEMNQGGFGFHQIWNNLVKWIENLDIEAIRKKAEL